MMAWPRLASCVEREKALSQYSLAPGKGANDKGHLPGWPVRLFFCACAFPARGNGLEEFLALALVTLSCLIVGASIPVLMPEHRACYTQRHDSSDYREQSDVEHRGVRKERQSGNNHNDGAGDAKSRMSRAKACTNPASMHIAAHRCRVTLLFLQPLSVESLQLKLHLERHGILRRSGIVHGCAFTMWAATRQSVSRRPEMNSPDRFFDVNRLRQWKCPGRRMTYPPGVRPCTSPKAYPANTAFANTF